MRKRWTQRTQSLNMYVERSGVSEVDITSLTTTSTIKSLGVTRSGFHAALDREAHVHVTPVKLVGEGLEIVGRAEFVVQLRAVCDPVAVVGVAVDRAGAVVVLRHGADPHWKGRETRGEYGRHGAQHSRNVPAVNPAF